MTDHADTIRRDHLTALARSIAEDGVETLNGPRYSTAHEQVEMAAFVLAFLAERQQAQQEIERLRDRAVCSGCGQDVDEGGACLTEDCDGEMIPSSGLPGALLEACEKLAEERAAWVSEWESLRAELQQAQEDLKILRDYFRRNYDIDAILKWGRK